MVEGEAQRETAAEREAAMAAAAMAAAMAAVERRAAAEWVEPAVEPQVGGERRSASARIRDRRCVRM